MPKFLDTIQFYDNTGLLGYINAAGNIVAIGNGAAVNVNSYAYGVAIGRTAYVNGSYGTAVGHMARACAPYSVSIGMGAYSYSNNGITIGTGAAAGSSSTSVTKNNAIAIGYCAKANAENSVVIGYMANVGMTDSNNMTYNSVIIGPAAYSNGNYSIAIGDNARVTQTSLLVELGSNWGIAIGTNAAVMRDNCIAIGHGAAACNATGITVIGSGAKGAAASATAVGYLSSAGTYGTAIGYSTVTNTDGTAVGNNATSLYYGTAVGNSAYSTNNSVAIGRCATTVNVSGASNDGCATAVGFYAKAQGAYSTAVGSMTNVSADQGIAIGVTACVTGTRGIAIGTPFEDDTNSIYRYPTASTNAVAIGTTAYADTAAVAIGNNATGAASAAVAIGNATSVPADYTGAIAIGCNASVGLNTYGTIPSSMSIRTAPIAIGANAVAREYEAYSSCISTWCPGIAIGENAVSNGGIAIGYNARAQWGQLVFGSPVVQSGTQYFCPNIRQIICYSQNTISTSSDLRIKQNVTLANTAMCLEDVNRLPVYRYQYKPYARGYADINTTGWIADDVQKVFTKAVIEADASYNELDDDGNIVYVDETDENGNVVYNYAKDEEGNIILDEEGNPTYDTSSPKQVASQITIEDQKYIDTGIFLPTLWGATIELTKRIEAIEAALNISSNVSSNVSAESS